MFGRLEARSASLVVEVELNREDQRVDDEDDEHDVHEAFQLHFTRVEAVVIV